MRLCAALLARAGVASTGNDAIAVPRVNVLDFMVASLFPFLQLNQGSGFGDPRFRPSVDH